MDELRTPGHDSEPSEVFDLEAALQEAREELTEESSKQDELHISDEVVLDLARKAMEKTEHIRFANTGLSAVLGISRKNADGLRITIDENDSVPSISVDAYLLIHYGIRIPDIAWDVQESLKKELERLTGYRVKAVNIHVQGIYFDDHDEEKPAETALSAEPVSEQ